MKQVVQSYKTGEVSLREVPVPRCGDSRILVRNVNSLISIGTERSTIELGKKSLLGKARARPDLVRRAWDKAKKEGLLKTYREAMGRLDTPTALGYSSAGIVIQAGPAATEFSPGDRVACIGNGFASHAEFVSTPVNMACRIPDAVTNEAAAFGMLGIIAMNGVRCAELTFGSRVAVLGLGLLGLLTVQLLNAYGCQIVAMDLEPSKADLAKELGAEFATTDETDLLQAALSRSHNQGVDAVIITAATKSRAPVDLAIQLSRFNGRIVVVGVADIHPDRNELWLKQLELVVSKAAGPGSLDPIYELEGVDLPLGEVRWTQKRNLEEFLRLLERGDLSLDQLITHRFPIDQAEQVYNNILSGELPNVVGALLNYSADPPLERLIPVKFSASARLAEPALAVAGAGLFGKALLLPALAKLPNVRLHTLVTSSGANAEHCARKFGFEQCATDLDAVWSNNEVSAVVGITPHSTHAGLVRQAVKHDKALFLEKPLCVTTEELDELKEIFAGEAKPPLVMIGHNRRFSPHAAKMAQWLASRNEPLVVQMRVNAGFVPRDHWVHSQSEGRSRIVGEMSHFVDLLQYLIGSAARRVYAERVDGDNDATINNDNVVVTLKFEDGSLAALIYSASGDTAYSRESLELFWEGKTIRSQDFRTSEFYTDGKKQKFKTGSQELGHSAELQHFVDCLRGEAEPSVSPQEMFVTMQVIFAIEQALATATPVDLVNDRNVNSHPFRAK